MNENNIVVTESIQLAPFRSINEFLLDKARYQLPTFNDLKKWNNRVVTNLLYYQTNYLTVALAFVLFTCFIHSRDVVLGTTAVAAILGAVLFALSKNAQLVQLRANYPYAVVLIVGISGYYFIYMLPSVITLLFTFALPILLTFVHASLRLRNFSSKVNIKIEQLRLNQTVMGQVLDLVGVVDHYN